MLCLQEAFNILSVPSLQSMSVRPTLTQASAPYLDDDLLRQLVDDNMFVLQTQCSLKVIPQPLDIATYLAYARLV